MYKGGEVMAHSHIAKSKRKLAHLTYADIVRRIRFDAEYVDTHLETVLGRMENWKTRLEKGDNYERGVFNEVRHLAGSLMFLACPRESVDPVISELKQDELWYDCYVTDVLVISTIRYLLTDYAEGIGKRQLVGSQPLPSNAAERFTASAKPVLSCCRRMNWSFQPEHILALGL
jgi:hypothetical protein